ncbi:MAG: PQQ-dependent sugar dehydrogenase [Aquimonas sp.]|nr:PQQ-dependent sugar dehydrogenase [Aquimonas sp.]
MRPVPALHPLALALLAGFALSACGPSGGQANASAEPAAAPSEAGAEAASTAAIETREVASQLGPITVSTLATGLENPWAVALLPDGRLLVTERAGKLRIVGTDGQLSEPLAGLPPILAEGQGGLMDVVAAPDFATSGRIYLGYSEPGQGREASTAVAHARLLDDRIEDLTVVFSQTPKLETRHHFGVRLVFDDAGYLFITLGDRGVRPTSQDLGSHMGGVIRIFPDGRVPEDNPFVGRDDALPEFWSYGHRNQQGAALNPWTRALWTHEHGPRGGDEINIPQPGKNYGWPIATHGINYSGEVIPEAQGTHVEGTEPPHHVWEVSPGVSGMAFYDHERFQAWQGSLFVGALAQRNLIRLSLDGDRITGEERLLGELGWRIRDVRVGHDGAVYVVTDEIPGRVLKLELAG